MWKFLIFTICLTQILSWVESCFLQRSLYVNSPGRFRPGHRVAKIETVGCDAKSTRLTVKDPSFKIKCNGEVVALTSVLVGKRGRTFSVCAQDKSGRESKIEVHLVHSTMLKRHRRGRGSLNRSKRRSDWRSPTINIVENYKRNYPEELLTLVVDAAEYHDVYYTIEGEGVDTYPTGVFSLDRDTGALLLLKAVDREKFPKYDFVVRAFDKHTNVELEEELSLRVIVDDVNDNAPEFVGPLQFTVPEHCSAGTVVGVVSATDRDQIGTDHVKIKYTLVSGSDMFTIHPETGVITTKTNTLDRELKDNHVVTVKIQDMNGAPNGLFATSTATIALSDINDNPPTFMKSSYNVTESEKLLRIPVQDKDSINTSNWMSKFVTTKGNENGNFRIVTDPQTNEGLLNISKPLDYEKTNDVQLQITAQNVASLNGSSATWQSIPVNVNVKRGDGSVSFGLLGIMTMLCPVVLLLLFFLVLVFFCLKKREKLQLYDFRDTGGIPLKSNTEAPEDSMAWE